MSWYKKQSNLTNNPTLPIFRHFSSSNNPASVPKMCLSNTTAAWRSPLHWDHIPLVDMIMLQEGYLITNSAKEGCQLKTTHITRCPGFTRWFHTFLQNERTFFSTTKIKQQQPTHEGKKTCRFDFLLVMLSVVELFMSGGSALLGSPVYFLYIKLRAGFLA